MPAVLAAAAVVLLALGAAASASARGSAAVGRGPLAAMWWLFSLAVLCAGAALVTRLRRFLAASEPPSTAEQRLRRGVLAVAATAVAVVPIALLVLHDHGEGTGGGECTSCPMVRITDSRPLFTPPTGVQRLPTKAGHTSLPLSTILFALCVVLAAAIVAALLVLLRRWLRGREALGAIGGAPLPAMAEGEQDDSVLGQAVLAGRAALEGDARAAVIACYAAMEDTLAAAGVPRLESDSPADLLNRAADRGAVDGPAPRLLAGLFREARYSTHAMNNADLDRARAALDEIAAQLAARSQAQGAPR